MPAATVAGNQSKQAASAPSLPFLQGSWAYSEPMFTDTFTLSTSQQAEQIHPITPGGFLRGITLVFTSTGGTLGSGNAVTADAPWALITSMSLESVDGTPILYPMGGYSYYLVSRFCRPWDGDPANDDSAAYSNTINPAFRMTFSIESRMTLGVLPNTDARAQYRFRYTIAAATQIVTTAGGTNTYATLTVTGALETYAQPPAADYGGRPIAPTPDGLIVQRFVSHEIQVTASGDTTYKLNRTGNLGRTFMAVFRNSSAARADLTGDPIRWRLDNTQLISENRTNRDYKMDKFFGAIAGGASNLPSAYVQSNRPTGVYIWPRWHNPGSMVGDYWLPTTEASFYQIEVNGAASSGTVEFITEDLAPTIYPFPPQYAYLEGI